MFLWHGGRVRGAFLSLNSCLDPAVDTRQDEVELLIVEDSKSDVELALRALKKHRLANNVAVARDGAEALDFIFCEGEFAGRSIEQQPRVVLLDLNLPLVSGLEILQRIRADSRTSSVPVVVMTASTRERDLLESYRLGVNSYIVKPLDFSKLVEAMKIIGMYWLMLNRPPTRR
jgi:two-component system, response regulator